MKITESELNLAYSKANELKINNSYVKEIVEIDIERNPLTDEEYFDSDSEFVTPFKLKFQFLSELGPRGSYVLITEVDVIGDDNEIIED